MRYLTAGESHGKYLAGILEGFPAGVKVTKDHIAAQLRRRRLAPGRSARQAAENDEFEIVSGMRGGLTTGAPVCVLLKNSVRTIPRSSSVPRPGHADLAGMLKYGTMDAVLIRERASARETAARVALGSFALRLHELLGISITSKVTALDGQDAVNSGTTEARILRARRAGDTLGGIFEVTVGNLPAGLGDFNHWDLRLGSRLAAAMLGINGVKGFEVGGGFGLAAMGGIEALKHPELSGGLDGGMTNGRALTLRCAVKPVPGLPGGAPSADLRGFRKKLSVSKTSDTTAVFAAAVVGEHAAALELAGALLDKFGGDSIGEILPRVEQWRKTTKRTLSGL